MQPSRRALAKGAAWATPALVTVAAAPAYALSCASKPWDATFTYDATCTSTNCDVVIEICSTTACGTSTSVPAGTLFVISLKNNSSGSDTISKASGSGYTIQSGSTGPGSGSSATLAAGATWTYNVTTNSALTGVQCIQFKFQNVDPGRSYTISATLPGGDGNNANSTGCTVTFTMATTSNLSNPFPNC